MFSQLWNKNEKSEIDSDSPTTSCIFELYAVIIYEMAVEEGGRNLPNHRRPCILENSTSTAIFTSSMHFVLFLR